VFGIINGLKIGPKMFSGVFTTDVFKKKLHLFLLLLYEWFIVNKKTNPGVCIYPIQCRILCKFCILLDQFFLLYLKLLL